MTKALHNSNQISRLVLKGFKSIAECDIQLHRLNVLIGANGAGKSNFIGFFRLINLILDKKLQHTVGEMGGPDALLYFGRKKTEELHSELYLDNSCYNFTLRPTQDNRMMFSKEEIWWDEEAGCSFEPLSGHFESELGAQKDLKKILHSVVPDVLKWKVYHFHDTGNSSLIKQIHGININDYLWEDARNLAAFLYRLKNHHATHYNRIIKTIQLVAPFFGDFYLRPTVDNKEKIQLEWTEINQEIPFTASALSDGTLRFICLATVLLQPEVFMPETIIIDEPELGLHPFAITVLAGLIESVSQRHQIIISTQSVELVNEFDVEDLIVVDKQDQASVLKRLNAQELHKWLTEYSLGDLWKKNVLGGRPA